MLIILDPRYSLMWVELSCLAQFNLLQFYYSFIARPCQFERVTYIKSYYIYEHVTYITVILNMESPIRTQLILKKLR
jgi:hypothetical protein